MCSKGMKWIVCGTMSVWLSNLNLELLEANSLEQEVVGQERQQKEDFADNKHNESLGVLHEYFVEERPAEPSHCQVQISFN